MDEAQFNTLAGATLERLEAALDAFGSEIDVELKPGGVLELDFADGSKIIINRHSAAREIWVAAKSGGFHYRFDGTQWVNTRDGEALFPALSRLASAQAGVTVNLA